MLKVKPLLERVDWIVVLPAILLNIIGLVIFLFLAQAKGTFEYMTQVPVKHLIVMLLGLIIFVFILFIPYEILFGEKTIVLTNIAIITLLIIAFLLPPYANTHRWINLGFFLIQPSELYKIGTLTATAYAFFTRKYRFLWFPLISLAFILFSPDLGMFLLHLIVILGVTVFHLTIRNSTIEEALKIISTTVFITVVSMLVHYALLGLIAVYITYLLFKKQTKPLLVALGFFIGLFILFEGFLYLYKGPLLKPYQKERLRPFIEQIQTNGIKGLFTLKIENFHTRQALIAIGSGGIKGKGPGQTTQSRLRFLPEAETDFMYATLSEMFGLLGALVVLLLYTIMVSRITYLLLKIPKPDFSAYILAGILTLIIIEITIGIGINLALLPTKGQPLPFLSYGGTSLITHYILLGFVSKVYYNYRKLV